MPNDLYIFSGLGADERVFQHMDFSGYTVNFIKWLTPHKKESIENYATRLLDQIKSPHPILIGLSFGGIMAVEIAKQIDTEKVILIASAKTKKEIPFYYRWAGNLRLHKLISKPLIRNLGFLNNWFFGARSAIEKQLLKQIITDTDATFLKWALNAAVRWKNETLLKNVFHIHGRSDRILPSKFVKYDLAIKKAGHLMTFNKAEELTLALRQQLSP